MKYISDSDKKNIKEYLGYLCLNSTCEKPLWNKEVLIGLKKSGWNYIDGCFLVGLMNLYEENHDVRIIEYIDNYVSPLIDENGNIKIYYYNNYNIASEHGKDSDPCNEGKILFNLYAYTKKEKYLKAIAFLHKQIEELPRIQGSFWHKEKYENQIWLDGLYMIQPFYARYEKELNYEKNYNDIVFQLENCFALTYDKKKHLMVHGYDGNYKDETKKMLWSNAKNGRSKIVWLRACGWYEMALVDTYEIIENKELRKRLKELLIKTIDGLLLYKDKKTNMFYQVVDYTKKKNNYLETSGSLMIAYAILKGVRLKMLNKRYRDIGLKIFNGVINKYFYKDTQDVFRLGGICIGAGLTASRTDKIAGTYKMYIERKVVEDDGKAIGPLMMALAEINYIERE